MWTNATLDANVAPGFSSFTEAPAPDLRPRFPNVEHWFADYFLNTVLSGRFSGGRHQIALGIIRRTQHAFFRYHEARELTAEFLSSRSAVNPQVRLYFRALDAWESFVLQSALAIDLLVAFGDARVFTKNDGSLLERIYTIANQIKHHNKCIASGQAPADHTVPLWLTNAGMCSFDKVVGFHESGIALEELATLAETLKDPEGAVRGAAAARASVRPTA